MDCVELLPSLSHCIETVAREEFWHSVNKYMEGGQEDKKRETKIELLKTFLESVDFKKLRSQSERYLVEGKTVKFVIFWKEGKPSHEMVVTEEGNAGFQIASPPSYNVKGLRRILDRGGSP